MKNSPYLDRPLRTLEQACKDTGRDNPYVELAMEIMVEKLVKADAPKCQ